MYAYCASKAALRSFADCVKHELNPKGIQIHLFMPSTIDSPGLKIENETKPKVTWEIEGTSTKISPANAAKCLLNGMKNGDYYITTEWLIDFLFIQA